MKILRLKATILDIEPPIWRRLEVPTDLTLDGLHRCLQSAFGWTNSHLHEFEVDGLSLAPPDLDDEFEKLNSRNQALWEFEGKVDTFVYTYDYGDDWRHMIEIEAWAEAEKGVQYPHCTGGARACPPEDCGGDQGYMNLIEIMKDPEHEEHDEMKEWVGPYFAPEVFDLRRANSVLKNVRTPSHKAGPGPWTKAKAKPRNPNRQDLDDQFAMLDSLAQQFKGGGSAMTPELQKALLDLAQLRIGRVLGMKKGGNAPRKTKSRKT